MDLCEFAGGVMIETARNRDPIRSTDHRDKRAAFEMLGGWKRRKHRYSPEGPKQHVQRGLLVWALTAVWGSFSCGQHRPVQKALILESEGLGH